MAELSPAAQAVMIAATNGNTNVVNDPVYRQCIAAALRAAADRVVPKCEPPCFAGEVDHADWFARDDVRDDLLRIATELPNWRTTNDHPHQEH